MSTIEIPEIAPEEGAQERIYRGQQAGKLGTGYVRIFNADGDYIKPQCLLQMPKPASLDQKPSEEVAKKIAKKKKKSAKIKEKW
jgi:hypothetical protein